MKERERGEGGEGEGGEGGGWAGWLGGWVAMEGRGYEVAGAGSPAGGGGPRGVSARVGAMPPGAFEGVVVRPPEVEGEDEGADADADAGLDVDVDVGGTHGAGGAEEGAGSGAGKLGNGGLTGRAVGPGSPGVSPGSPSATLRHKGPTLVEAYALWLGQSGAAADTALSAVSGLSYLLLGREGEADGGGSREVLGEVLGVAVRMVQLFHGFARSLGSTPTELLALRRSRGGAPPSFARDVLWGKREQTYCAMTMIDKLIEMGDKIKWIYRINTDCIVLDRKCNVKFDKRVWKEEDDLRWRQNMGGDVYLHEISAHDPPHAEDTRTLGGMISYHCGPAGHGKTYTNLFS